MVLVLSAEFISLENTKGHLLCNRTGDCLMTWVRISQFTTRHFRGEEYDVNQLKIYSEFDLDFYLAWIITEILKRKKYV